MTETPTTPTLGKTAQALSQSTAGHPASPDVILLLVPGNDSAEGSCTLPYAVLTSLVDLLSEVGSARLKPDNSNARPSSFSKDCAK